MSHLHEAKKEKNDEFYTLYEDVEREVNFYYKYDKNFLRGKVILCPCDDPMESSFTKFFVINAQKYGIRRVISTSYAKDFKRGNDVSIPFLWGEACDGNKGEIFPCEKSLKSEFHGRVFIWDELHDVYPSSDDEYISFCKWTFLQGDGDFRSGEVTKFRDEADIIITNPPFSLFREFMRWIQDGKKKFLIMGEMNAIAYKEIFPLIRENKIWMGKGFNMRVIFKTPNKNLSENNRKLVERMGKNPDDGFIMVPSICWFTNMDYERRHHPLELLSYEENEKGNNRVRAMGGYKKYDNYDALEIPCTSAIPSDYSDVMGVPISFLGKFCPEQFEIIGLIASALYSSSMVGIPLKGMYSNGKPLLGGEETYARIVIRHKK